MMYDFDIYLELLEEPSYVAIYWAFCLFIGLEAGLLLRGVLAGGL